MTRRGWLALAGLGALLACAEWAGPELGGPRLAVVPVFGGGGGTVLLNDLDHLHVVVTTAGGGGGVVVADTTVPVDSAGDATLTVSVLLVGTVQAYTVQVQGIRSSDGSVLYSGFDTITVRAGRATRVDSVPVSYLGPCQLGAKCSVAVGPQNQTLPPAGSFTLAVTVLSAAGGPVPLMPVRLSNVTPGLAALASNLTVTALSGTSCGPARIAASIPGATDTLRLAVSAPVTASAVLFAGDSANGLSSGVFCNNTDGTGRFRISRNGAVGDVNPRYSPDRQRVAFTFRSTGPTFLYIARWAADTEAVAVGDTSAARPRWSPNGAHLAFACGDGFSADQDVCVFLNAKVPISAFINAPRSFVTDSVRTRIAGPSTFAWDPVNPDRLAFVRDSLTTDAIPKTTSAIYVANFDGTAVTQLTPQPLNFGTGVLRIRELEWSPRGDVIVFTATDTLFQSKLYAVNRDGTGVRPLTTGSDRDSHPVISPDGRQVLFTRVLASSCLGALDYWRIGIDGAGAQRVSDEMVTCDASTAQLGYDWSPDGQAVVLVGISDHRIYAMPAATTAATYFQNRVLIGRAPDATSFVNDFQPSWRP